MGQGTGKDHLVRYAAPGCQALQDMGISLAHAEIPHSDTHGVELRNGTNDKSMPLMGNIHRRTGHQRHPGRVLGADVVRQLKNHKVNTDYVLPTPDGMGTWLAVFDNQGDVCAAISKRPDLRPLIALLDEKGDEIFRDADSIALEIDMDKEIVKRVFQYARKYQKDVYAVVSNMSIAVERRDFLQQTSCFVCNQQEMGILFSDDYSEKTPEELQKILALKIRSARIPRMIVTMGAQGAVYASCDGDQGACPGRKVDVKDTTGAGDAFFAGATIGLTYGKTLAESCEIGTRLAASTICTSGNVCPRFLPEEFGLDVAVTD